jgi:hypothetical protein
MRLEHLHSRVPSKHRDEIYRGLTGSPRHSHEVQSKHILRTTERCESMGL